MATFYLQMVRFLCSYPVTILDNKHLCLKIYCAMKGNFCGMWLWDE